MIAVASMGVGFFLGGAAGLLQGGDFETCHALAMDYYQWALDFTGGDEELATHIANVVFQNCMNLEPE